MRLSKRLRLLTVLIALTIFGAPLIAVAQSASPTAWEQYRWQIILIAVALLTLTLVTAYVLLQNHRRRRAEKSLAESEERMAITAASTNTGLRQFKTASSGRF